MSKHTRSAAWMWFGMMVGWGTGYLAHYHAQTDWFDSTLLLAGIGLAHVLSAAWLGENE